MTLTPRQEIDTWTSGAKCPDAEALASYVDGRATAAERTRIESHLANCDDCYFVFSETVQQQQSSEGRHIEESPITRRLVPWARLSTLKVGYAVPAGLAAAAVIVVAVGILNPFRRTDPVTVVQVQAALSELDAAAGPYRKYAPRLTATPGHRELEPGLRSADSKSAAEGTPAQREAAQRALREAVQRVEAATAARGIGLEGPRARAAMYFALGRPQLAVDALEPVAQSNNAGILSDVAAVHLARQADGDVERALDLLERAVTLDDKCAEAWFNLGLAAEAALKSERARDAWTRYLALDPSSEWANEARWHLEKLQR